MLKIIYSFKFLIIISLFINNVQSICDQIKNYCECEEKRVNFHYNVYCPRHEEDDSKLKYDFKFTVHSVNLEIDCLYSNQTEFLLKVFSKLHNASHELNIKHIYISNCLSNNTSVNLNQFLNNLNINSLDTLILKSAELITINEESFFNYFNFNALRIINYENVTFTSWNHLNLTTNVRKIILNNNNLTDNKINTLNLTKLTQLSIENNRDLSYFNFDYLGSLQLLILMDNGLRKIDKPILKNLKDLKIFSIEDNNLTEISDSVQLFENNKFLNHLLIENEMKLLKKLPNDLLRHTTNLVKIFIHCGLIEIDENFFMGLKNVTMLLLNNNNLKTLPENLFSDLNNLEVLDLSGNMLVMLPKNIFKKNGYLTTLDLSHNKLTDLSDTYMFQSLTSLTDLSLRYNELSRFKLNAHQMEYLETIYLDHNKLTFDANSCPITNLDDLDPMIKLDLSWNMITNLSEVQCFLTDNKIGTIKLNGNFITTVLLSNFNRTFQSINVLNKYIELNSNNITAIDFLETSIEYPFESSEYHEYYDEPTITYFISVSNNPIVCYDCDNLLHERILLDTKLNNIYITLTKDDDECRSSVNCSLDELHEEEFICPYSCHCNFSKLSEVLFIDCSNRNITALPVLTVFPLNFNVEHIHLDISHNTIQVLNLSYFSADIAQKMAKINAEHNQIDSIEIDHDLKNLKILMLASNKLKDLDYDVFYMLMDKNLELSISDNPWYCSVGSFDLNDLKNSDTLIIVDRNQTTCVDIEQSANDVKRHMSIGLVILVILILVIGSVAWYCLRKKNNHNIWLARRQRNNLELNDTFIE